MVPSLPRLRTTIDVVDGTETHTMYSLSILTGCPAAKPVLDVTASVRSDMPHAAERVVAVSAMS